MMQGYYWAIRKRDKVQVIVWCYLDAKGEQCCACARTHACTPDDFMFLGGVTPFSTPFYGGDYSL